MHADVVVRIVIRFMERPARDGSARRLNGSKHSRSAANGESRARRNIRLGSVLFS